ncbi:serine hydrolase [Guptibacillus algicola]|uniref:serine hydrolase n=1 Tax=Guptibacillus algicola TaxID=225844 RepID=UPI001CD2E6ED|nr:serine hydrolase [Alkalihalobacillus algicola]MCA0986935.1 serine hydrolase [Alkalihalobacillus algicola]
MKFAGITKMFVVMMVVILTMGTPLYSTANAMGKNKLSHGSAKSVDMNASTLDKIDDVVYTAIESNITPGAVVLIAKDGKIVKESAYGYAEKYDMGMLLDDPRKMKKKTIFDLASLTKVMGTTQGIMKLVSDGKLSVDDRVTDYIPEFGKNGKEDVTVADLLTHTSGLTPWQPTYLEAGNSDEVLETITNLPLEYETGTDRRYSDFSFMTLGFIIERVSGQRLDQYLKESVYDPLKMKDTMFTPSDKLDKKIAATSWGNPFEHRMIDDPDFGYFVPEDADEFSGWRNYTLVGEVNDGNSFYANGGVAGHAGLFSTARDLAILGQAMLNGGSYGKTSLYDESTFSTFTHPQRFGQGYGFELNKSWYMGDRHSNSAFGHTGFTGTKVIFDPAYNLQFIVLTNKQNNGPKENGFYPSTGGLSKDIANLVYKSIE